MMMMVRVGVGVRVGFGLDGEGYAVVDDALDKRSLQVHDASRLGLERLKDLGLGLGLGLGS